MKKFVSIVLCVMMLVGIVPFSAAAEGETLVRELTFSVEYGGEYPDFTTRITNAREGYVYAALPRNTEDNPYFYVSPVGKNAAHTYAMCTFEGEFDIFSILNSVDPIQYPEYLPGPFVEVIEISKSEWDKCFEENGWNIWDSFHVYGYGVISYPVNALSLIVDNTDFGPGKEVSFEKGVNISGL